MYPSSSSDERTYQEYIAKTLQEKCNSLNAQLESLVRDSNTEISRLPSPIRLTLDLRNGLQASKNDLEQEKKRSHELQVLLQEKTKHSAKVQVLPHLH